MDIELHQFDLRYEKLRRRDARKERQLTGSLAERGQLLPVLVVRDDASGKYVLVDGYKRVRAIRALRGDAAQAMVWEISELQAVLLERLMRKGESESAMEQGWLLEELSNRFGLSHQELARRFDKSQSWISRRLALVRALPHEVQQCVHNGAVPAHAAMKYLVPMARAKRGDCVRLVGALAGLRPSTRDVGALYSAWSCGNRETRELVVTTPHLVLRAREQARQDGAGADREKSAGRKLLDDFGILIGTSRRLRAKLAQGVLPHLLPPEEQQARRAAQQARWECEALFRYAAPLFFTAATNLDLSVQSSPTADTIQIQQGSSCSTNTHASQPSNCLNRG